MPCWDICLSSQAAASSMYQFSVCVIDVCVRCWVICCSMVFRSRSCGVLSVMVVLLSALCFAATVFAGFLFFWLGVWCLAYAYGVGFGYCFNW